MKNRGEINTDSKKLLDLFKNYSYSIQYIAFAFGSATFLIGLMILIFFRDIQSSGVIIVSLGIASLIISLILNATNIGKGLLTFRGLYGINTFFILIAVIFILVATNSLIYILNSRGSSPDWFRYDLTATKEYDLSSHAISALENLTEDLEVFIKKNNVKEVLLAIPSISRTQKRQIIDFLASFPVIVRSLPSVSELTQGKVKVNDLLEIDIRDLLGRDSVSPNKDLLKINISKKVVLVTGAGGSIGSELSRQIVFLKPEKLILYDISESSLYIIEQELLNINVPNVEIFPVIGSITDKDRLKYICNYYEVQTIYHAAAYKHVPLVEYNQSQGVLNNAIGTMIAAEAAISSNVETFVLISTDKAVRPTNTMGATKRFAEMILQALSIKQSKTQFTIVRFGNVLGSSGSVIPLFRKQIKNGGPLTVTDSKVVRYFMTVPEAVELVIQAGAMGSGGDVFVLDMGEPIRILDLAKKMIYLSGLSVRDDANPNGDIEIKYTGLRPGEKLYEELLIGGNTSKTDNPMIMRAQEDMLHWNELKAILDNLEEAAINCKPDKIRELLLQAVPEFKPQSDINDILHEQD